MIDTSDYVYLLVIEEEGYFSEVSECGRYCFLTDMITETVIWDDIEEVSKVQEKWGGEIIKWSTK